MRARSERAQLVVAGAIGIALATISAVGFVRVAPPGVYLSVDGGAKMLMTDQLARGELVNDVRLRHHDALRELYDDGMMPIPEGTNFYHRQGDRMIPGFPWPWPALNVPAYALLGERGLLVLPFLGVIGLALAFVVIGRAAGWSAWGLLAAMLAAGFATPITVYAGIAWEHSFATLLATVGLAELAFDRAHRARTPALGACLGATFWLRPEGAPLVAAVLLALLVVRRRGLARWAPYAAVAGAVAAALLLFNQALYGSWLGPHADQALGLDLQTHLARARELGWWMLAFSTELTPHVWLVLPVAGAILYSPALHRRPGALEVVVALPVFLGLTSLIVPNTGGHQIGARYFFFAYPLIAFAFGTFVTQCRGAFGGPARWLLVPLLALGLMVSTRRVHREGHVGLAQAYGTECTTALRARPDDDVLAFADTWYAVHAAGSFEDRLVLGVPDLRRLHRAMDFAASRDVGLVVVTTNYVRYIFDGHWPAGTERLGSCGGSDLYRLGPTALSAPR